MLRLGVFGNGAWRGAARRRVARIKRTSLKNSSAVFSFRVEFFRSRGLTASEPAAAAPLPKPTLVGESQLPMEHGDELRRAASMTKPFCLL